MHLPDTQNCIFQSLSLILGIKYLFISNKSFTGKVNNLRAKLINSKSLPDLMFHPRLYSLDH